jgi:hypothetical protein
MVEMVTAHDFEIANVQKPDTIVEGVAKKRDFQGDHTCNKASLLHAASERAVTITIEHLNGKSRRCDET